MFFTIDSLTESQSATLLLWQQTNASLSAFAKLISAYQHAQQALAASAEQWRQLGIHAAHVARHQDIAQTKTFVAQTQTALTKQQYRLVFLGEPDYPAQLEQLYDPPPVLFYQGNIARLQQAQIAMVGSRKPSQQAQKITYDLAQYLAAQGYVITSGLAQGVDKQAHLGALDQTDPQHGGRSVGVMGTGIDQCYPKQHAPLFAQMIASGGCLISELLPHTPANKHTFPRRNRLVAGLSLGTIVTEAALQSGSLITARLTSEQGKQVFAIPSHINNINAQGCHHLIREGATLVYHPEQVLEDLHTQQQRLPTLLSTNSAAQTTEASASLPDHPTQNAAASPSAVQPPEHLQPLFARLEWVGQDLDALVSITQLDAPTLLGQLMELELLGLIEQRGGRYQRL